MKDRRRSERHNLIMYLRVHDQSSGELLGHVVDLSTGGLMLVSDTPFKPKSIYKLGVALPYTEQADSVVEIDVECRWCGPDINDDYYDVGFRFIYPTAELRELIAGLIEDVGFLPAPELTPDGEQRPKGSFPVYSI